jgi:subtilisin family serine protease
VNSPLVLNDTLKIVASGDDFNQSNDACTPLNSTYNDTILLIHQGDCSSLLKIQHAKAAGAVAVVLYTDDKNQTASFETLSTAVLPVAFINNDDGSVIYDQHDATALFTNTLVALVAPASDYGMVSGYSTLGPTNELNLKPELVAVGGNVFSTLPRYLNMYGFRSGTSFSAPYIAANVALLLANVNQTIEPTLAKNILMNFATQGNITPTKYICN